MRFSTANKISLLCLLGLAAEIILSYYTFSSYAFYMAGEGVNYASPGVYAGPAGTLAKAFYVIMGLTLAGVILPLIIAGGTWLFQSFTRTREKNPPNPKQ